MDAQARRVPAARQTLQILTHLASRRGPVSASAIAQALDLPRSTTYQMLSAMRDEGFVVHFPEERLYGLGLRAMELSSAYTRHDPLARIGKPLVERLVDHIRESAHLAVMHGRDVYYVVAERARHRPSPVSRVGIRLPAHLTASGRAMLAAMPREQVTALFPRREVFSTLTEQDVIVSPRELQRELAATAERGYAIEVGAVDVELASVASPVLDHVGMPVAAVAVTFRAESTDDAKREALAAEARATAVLLSGRIGNRDATP